MIVGIAVAVMIVSLIVALGMWFYFVRVPSTPPVVEMETKDVDGNKVADASMQGVISCLIVTLAHGCMHWVIVMPYRTRPDHAISSKCIEPSRSCTLIKLGVKWPRWRMPLSTLPPSIGRRPVNGRGRADGLEGHATLRHHYTQNHGRHTSRYLSYGHKCSSMRGMHYEVGVYVMTSVPSEQSMNARL